MQQQRGWVVGLAGLFSMTLVAQAVAEETATITVEAAPLPLLGGNRVIPAEGRGVAADGGELLREVPGVSLMRLGGKGLDPVIRGQQQNRLNILIDGAYVFGGCPNRMDPPASFANIEAYDRVTVLKGVQTLQYGGGGPGGTVLFERGVPTFTADDSVQGKAAASYAANGGRGSLFGDLAVGGEQGYLRFQASKATSDNYEDGDGNEVRSGYDERGGTLVAGWTPDAATRLELSLEDTSADDVLYAGSMDAPVDDNRTVRLKGRRDLQGGVFRGVSAELYRTRVDHVMDNYSLRTAPTMMGAPMLMVVESDSITRGARLNLEATFAGADWLLGIDRMDSERDATRRSNRTMSGALAAPTVVDSVMWPGSEIDQLGLFGEGEWRIDEAAALKAGLRYDRVDASASRANEMPAMGMTRMSANALYRSYYATADGNTDHDENNWGGLLRYERDFTNGTWFVGFSRSVRTADVTERYLAANSATTALRWVGNPNLDPERHHQLDLGVSVGEGRWSLGGVVYTDWVDDYILRDRAHGQSGILLADNATIYRNVEARLYGFEMDGRLRIDDHWSLSGNLAYVRGENESDNRDLAQIPPLELRAALDYVGGPWSAGVALRAADQQSHVDDNMATGSGLDVGPTDGWAVLDLHGRYRITKAAAVEFGVDNLFDETYATHLNRANAFDPTTVQINEPGRNVWAKVSYRW
ncbi:TonB-dependent copper receptor [Endothiovibrio diazotrophicus]